MTKPKLTLRYDSPAPEFNEFAECALGSNSWERYSLPLGNGYFGANVFGRCGIERIQISEASLSNTYYVPKTVKRRAQAAVGVNSFAEILIDLGHEDYTDYERTLSLDDATAGTKYRFGGVEYTRTVFTSYPARTMAIRLTASKTGALSFTLKPFIPFIGDFVVEEGDGFSKTGTVTANGTDILLEGTMGYYGLDYFGILRVIAKGGVTEPHGAEIRVEGADEAVILFSCDTSYVLSSQAFTEEDPRLKLRGCKLDREAVIARIDRAEKMGYDALYREHLDDYHSLFGRVSLSITGDSDPNLPTDILIKQYKEGTPSRYLEMLLFQYGRYLLISSSRSRLPAHLQGIWNCYSDSPWSCGYWHNINVQMNYWPSGPANLSETFIPYANYAKAYMPLARRHADLYIRTNYPERLSPDGENGWIVGTGGSPYRMEGFLKLGHSGPGTGGFTSLLFWDYFDYTRDLDFLREIGYPALREMSVFFSKILVEYDGKYLIRDSASPENVHNGACYHTVGCAFDQQMVYENFMRTVDAAKILGCEDEFTEKIAEMAKHTDPVLIGDDGQVKEYREETYYSSIGDPKHRHISHLVGLYPGTVINENTPEWLEGARITLRNRGDISTCWAVAHRLLLWARVKCPEKCRDLINSFIQKNVHDNLWCNHPPFQIDGNFGFTAGVCEMLLQSQAGYIELLPSPAPEWQSGEFTGIVARGGFELDCRWESGRVSYVRVLSRTDSTLKIKLPEHLIPEGATVTDGILMCDMKKGETLIYTK